MWQTRIICTGRLKSGPYAELQAEYIKRLSPNYPQIIEIDDRKLDKKAANKLISDNILENKPLFILDEVGKAVSSSGFCAMLQSAAQTGGQPVQFVIGPTDGLTDDIRKRADKSISFGRSTWPHFMVRVLLLEQIYRAKTIASGHPYHR